MSRTPAKSLSEPVQADPASEQGKLPSNTLAASTGLPTLNVAQDAVLQRELRNRLDQFKTFVEVVVAEINGMNMRYDQDSAEREQKHSQAISELEKQKDDLLRGVRRLERSLAEEEQE